MVLFELRSKVFINKIAYEMERKHLTVTMESNTALQDSLFGELFAKVYDEIIGNKEASIQEC